MCYLLPKRKSSKAPYKIHFKIDSSFSYHKISFTEQTLRCIAQGYIVYILRCNAQGYIVYILRCIAQGYIVYILRLLSIKRNK